MNDYFDKFHEIRLKRKMDEAFQEYNDLKLKNKHF